MLQKYHDFIEVATEAIGEFTKDVDGVKKAMWEKEEVDEIVIAQVKNFNALHLIEIEMVFLDRLSSSYWPVSIQQPLL